MSGVQTELLCDLHFELGICLKKCFLTLKDLLIHPHTVLFEASSFPVGQTLC